MNEQELLSKLVAPGQKRPTKWRQGVIQIHVTRSCDKACINCTQGSNLGGKATFITPEQFEQAVLSLKGYFGVVGVFGGNPALHPQFAKLCEILRKHIPFEQRGLWCNHPLGKAKVMRETFNPSVSNLNVHLDQDAYDEFKRDWPECHPVGLTEDSRHAPVYVAMKDLIEDEEKRNEIISTCQINLYWSAMIGVFRGQLRAWFCEIAGAQSILHQDDPEYPDTGVAIGSNSGRTEERKGWWELPMGAFRDQVRKHCHDCGIPLRGYGELAQSKDGVEQVSATHQSIYKPKRFGRKVELVLLEEQLGRKLEKMTDYIGNAKR